MTSQTLVRLLTWLEARGYDFVTPTPSTSRRAHDRGLSAGDPVRAALGWSQAFTQDSLAPELFEILQAGKLLTTVETGWKSRVRASRLGGRLFLHSAFPATASDAVFLGPDSYRFARFLNALTVEGPVRAIAEIGCGAGVGGLVAALRFPAASVVLGDINPKALDLAAANAAAMDVKAKVTLSDGMAGAAGPLRPDRRQSALCRRPVWPRLQGRRRHARRAPGLDWAARPWSAWHSAGRSRSTPAAPFWTAASTPCVSRWRGWWPMGGGLTYEELDPDIFSGELRREAYADVERIAAVGAVILEPAAG
jgi:hypothetical protein